MNIILDGLVKFLTYINDNWALLTTIVGLVLVIYKKYSDYSKKTKEEKIEIAKLQISEIMLKLVTEAEKDYLLWIKAGSIKRSQVIDQIFAEYPVLSTITNQKEIIAWIDDTINAALKEMRKIFEENKTKSEQEKVEAAV